MLTSTFMPQKSVFPDKTQRVTHVLADVTIAEFVSSVDPLMTRGMQRVAVDRLPTDRICSSRVYDDNGRILVNEGAKFTAHIRDGLLSRGITEVFVRCREPGKSTKLQGKTRTAEIYVPVFQTLKDWTGKAYDKECKQRFDVEFADLNNALQDTFAQCHDSSEDVDRIANVPETLLQVSVEDQDLAIASSCGDWKNGSFSSRSIAKASLAMAIGIELGYLSDEVIDLGMVALLHDWGISRLPANLQQNESQLGSEELWQYKKHPLVTAKLLQSQARVSSRVLTAITQVHERPDGSGYPLGLRGARISQLARTVAAVDTFFELIQPGRNRDALVPHDAAVILRRLAETDKLCSAPVDALVSRLSIFPIGTRVTLDDGLQAIVIRRTKDAITLPTVQLLGVSSDLDPIVPLYDSESRIVEVEGSRLGRKFLHCLESGNYY